MLLLEIGLLLGIVNSKTFLSHRHTLVFVWHQVILYTYSWSSLFTLCPTVECKYFNEKILLPQTAFLRNFQSLRETSSKVNLKCLDYAWVHIDGHFWIKSVDNLLACDWLCVDYFVKETISMNCVFFIVYETLQVDSFFLSYRIELSITTWSEMMSLYIYV